MRYRVMPDEPPPDHPEKDRLLPDEATSADSGTVEDLRRWVATYRQLYEFKEHLLSEIADQMRRVGERGRAELDNDLKLMERERERIGLRLRYWEAELERRSRS